MPCPLFTITLISLQSNFVMHWLFSNSRSVCARCGASFSLCRTLNCRKGGLVTQYHNEICDALGDLLVTGYKEVLREPILQEDDGSTSTPVLVADLRVRSVWQLQTVALLDVRVVDTDAQPYTSRSVSAVLSAAEQEKKRKYLEAAEPRHSSFTPFVLSVDGMMGPEASCFLKRVAEQRSFHWNKPYSIVMGWVKVRMEFATIYATNLFSSGSRTK